MYFITCFSWRAVPFLMLGGPGGSNLSVSNYVAEYYRTGDRNSRNKLPIKYVMDLPL
jgi:hypothetical protein